MESKEVIELNINNACIQLYAEQKVLIDEASNELNVVGHLVPILRLMFTDWDVDTDYNREGPDENRVTKTDLDGRALKPDIVIHQHGQNKANHVAIEVKGYWNKESRDEDEKSLKRLRAKHGYNFLYRLELGKDVHQLIPVE